jgi:hypothetical protein
MNDRYRVTMLAAVLFGLADHAQARDFSYQKSWIVAQRAQSIEEMLIDYDNYCDQGCKYRYPSVRQALTVSFWRRPRSFYVWTFVENIQNSKWFSHVTISKAGDQTIVRFTMITDDRIRTLERFTGKPHRPLFDACQTEYQIRELSSDNRFPKSVLIFRAEVTVTGLIAWFGGAILGGLADTGRAIYQNVAEK